MKKQADFEIKTLEVRITFTEGILGTSPSDKEIYTNFVLDKAKAAGAKISDDDEAEELEALPDELDEIMKGKTVFPRTKDGTPFLYDYQIKGFFKDTCGGLRKVPGTKSSGITTYKKNIDNLIFTAPREIVFHDWTITDCERPLRAQTPLGERTALAKSEEIAAGAWVEFEINMLDPRYEAAVREWLNYGRLKGIGQWRNSGKGRFEWEEIRCY